MAPPVSGAAARRGPARTAVRPAPSATRRPPLRVFEPVPRRRTGPRSVRRPAVWLSALLVVGSLLAVVAGDAVVAQGQVRISSTQHEVAAALTAQKALQVAVAGKAAPPVVVSMAKTQLHLVVPSNVIDLPRVRLDVPLPVPQTAPASR